MKRVLVTCLFSFTAWGQLATTTALVGNVSDSAGALVTGVAITAVDEGTSESYSAVTSGDGYYSLQFIKPGTYAITASIKGFETVKKTGITVATNQIVRTDFTMKVGQVTETVTVSGAPTPIATDDAAISETIDTRLTLDLPLNGRDTLRLATSVPNVLPGKKDPSGNPGGGEGFIGAGVREIQNSVSLDGVSIMNNLITTTTFRPTIDAIQEVLVQTGTYPAQYGGYMGLQMNVVTKTGTNLPHGSVFEFVRNSWLDARGFFNTKPKPQAPFRQNQFGFELDGPVWIPKLYDGRNKTFFLTSYEGQRTFQNNPSPETVLTPLMRAGDFSELLQQTRPVQIKNPLANNAPLDGNLIPPSLLSPQALRALKYMPSPNLPGITNNYLADVLFRNTTNQSLDRVDQNFREKTRLFFRYAWENSTLLNGNTNPYNGYDQPVTDRNFVVGWTQLISPRMINDARFGRQHTTIDSVNFFHTAALANAGTELGIPGFTTDLANSGLPVLAITGYLAIGGQNMASSNWYQTDTTWQGTDVLNYTRGAHSFSIGLEIRKLITLRTANNAPRGQFNFTGGLSGSGAADFILGLPQNLTTPGPLFPGGAEEYRDGFFFTDKWQVGPRLTLNIGLRYELPTVPDSATGNGTILDPAQTHFIPEKVPSQIPFNDPTLKDFAPRFGFAYRATKNWVLRGGYGIYYNPNQLNTYTLSSTNPPFSTIVTYNYSASNGLSLANPTPPDAAGAAPKPNAFTINPHLPTAYLNQWSFDVERPLWQSAGLDIQYLGSHSVHLDRSFFNNTPLPAVGNIDARRPNQLFRQIRTIQNDEIANYESLAMIYRQQVWRGFSGRLSYTWSHTLDVSTDSNGGGAPMDPYNWRADYGNSNWDLRHRFVAGVVYDLPFGKSSPNVAVKQALANWQVNLLTTIQSGFPFNITIAPDQANTGASNQRPNVAGVPHADCGSGRLANCISTAEFLLPVQYTYGNFGKNVLRGPGLVNWDFSLFKNIPIHERVKFQIRAEVFNLLNTPGFANPNAAVGTPPTTVGGTGAIAGNFGTVTTTVNNNRQIQLAARFTF
jgi:hypothetical protein